MRRFIHPVFGVLARPGGPKLYVRALIRCLFGYQRIAREDRITVNATVYIPGSVPWR